LPFVSLVPDPPPEPCEELSPTLTPLSTVPRLSATLPETVTDVPVGTRMMLSRVAPVTGTSLMICGAYPLACDGVISTLYVPAARAREYSPCAFVDVLSTGAPEVGLRAAIVTSASTVDDWFVTVP
jgi:hypothetical protein